MTDTAKPDSMDGLLQDGRMVPSHGLTQAMHIGESDLPWVDLGDGSMLQLLQVDLQLGLWVLRIKFQPGYTVQTHYHTGSVFAVTLSGQWYYKEYPDDVNSAGSYLYEPAHSLHTLTVPDDLDELTDVWFAVYGANVNIDGTGAVTGITDAQAMLNRYQTLCDAQGQSYEKLIINGAHHQ